MRHSLTGVLVVVAWFGCDDGSVDGDAASDTIDDDGADVAIDSGEGVSLDAVTDDGDDTIPDSTIDPDATLDAVEDPAGDDAGGDPVTDAVMDEDLDGATDPEAEPPPPCTSIDTIADARAVSVPSHGDGVDVGLTLCDVLVTYVHDAGFFVQVDPIGPAIGVDTVSAPSVAFGDLVDLSVTRIENVHGNIVVMGSTVLGSEPGYSAEAVALTRDMSAGVLPDPALSDELSFIGSATVTAVRGPSSFDISYGTAVDVPLWADEPGPLCVGATLDVTAVVEQYDGTFLIHSYKSADFSAVDTWWCGVPPVTGDIVLNEFLADPPTPDGDANCDGVRVGLGDEFVELVNVSLERISLEGVSIWDSVATRRNRHVFESWRVLEPGEAIVVFGGGDPGSNMSSSLGCIPWPTEVQVTVANQSYASLGLNNTGDTIELWYDEGGAWETMLLSHTFGPEGESDESWTLNPDVTGTLFELHSTADTVDGSPWSPGTRVDGVVF